MYFGATEVSTVTVESNLTGRLQRTGNTFAVKSSVSLTVWKNKKWYSADERLAQNRFVEVKPQPGFKPTELTTTFNNDNKLVVNTMNNNNVEEEIELAKYMQNLLKDYRRVYPTKYNKDSSRGHCIFQITLEHHGKPNNMYIGDLAGVEDVYHEGARRKGS
jgi:hypothetical protein